MAKESIIRIMESLKNFRPLSTLSDILLLKQELLKKMVS
jgi:hypothetical protein